MFLTIKNEQANMHMHIATVNDCVDLEIYGGFYALHVRIWWQEYIYQ